MKSNEAGFWLRVFSALIGIFALIGLAIFLYAGVFLPGNADWRVVFIFLLFGISFSYIAIAGYLPRLLLRIFTFGHGSVADRKDLR